MDCLLSRGRGHDRGRGGLDGARDLFALVNRDRERVLNTPGGTVMAARLFEALPGHPVMTIATAVKLLDTTRPTTTKAVTALVDAGVLAETSGKKRDRRFAYAAYLNLLKTGTGLD